MAWTTPKTWSSEPLTSADLNTYIRDNQEYLKTVVDGTEGESYDTLVTANTTSTTPVDVDATNLSFTMTTNGGAVLVSFIGRGYNASSARRCAVYVDVDGTDYKIDMSRLAATVHETLSGIVFISGLSAGEHTFNLQFSAHPTGNTSYIEVEYFAVKEII